MGIVLYKKRKIYGILVSFLPIICCIAIRGYFASVFDFESEEMVDGLYSDSFIKPWTRMSPYFIGVVTMLLFLKKEEKQTTDGSLITSTPKIGKYLYFSSLFSGCCILLCLLSFPHGNTM